MTSVVRRSLFGLIALAVLAAGTIGGLGCYAFSAPRYQGPRSDHFDGESFFYKGAEPIGGFGDFVKWQRTRQRGHWYEVKGAWPGPKPPARVGRGELRVTFVNHATVLIQADGLNVLTDPIWSERCSPVSFAGPKRVRPPGLRFEDLPPIDAIVVSHNHYDHMDVPTLKRLKIAWPRARLFAGLGNAAFLRERGLRAEELDWWQSVGLAPGVALHGVPAKHFSNRGFADRNGTLFMGWVLKGPSGAAFFAGDTGYGPHFAEIGQRLGPIRLAMLPIGAYKPQWFMAPVHVDPEHAVRAHEDLRASTSLGMHFGTFELADESQDEAPQELARALARRPAPQPRFWVLGFGEGRDVP